MSHRATKGWASEFAEQTRSHTDHHAPYAMHLRISAETVRECGIKRYMAANILPETYFLCSNWLCRTCLALSLLRSGLPRWHTLRNSEVHPCAYLFEPTLHHQSLQLSGGDQSGHSAARCVPDLEVPRETTHYKCQPG
jgi:hypothetical protein